MLLFSIIILHSSFLIDFLVFTNKFRSTYTMWHGWCGGGRGGREGEEELVCGVSGSATLFHTMTFVSEKGRTRTQM
jgi:hypothetical protein